MSLLGSEVLSLLPPAVREAIAEPQWWRHELAGLQTLRADGPDALPPAPAPEAG